MLTQGQDWLIHFHLKKSLDELVQYLQGSSNDFVIARKQFVPYRPRCSPLNIYEH